MKILSWIKKFIYEFPAHFIATCLTLLIIGAVAAGAASSYDVASEAQMFLDASITSSSTTIVLSSPQVNGSNHTFTTATGGVVRIRSGAFREDVYYTAATVSATTNKVTLTGLTRNLCPYATRTYVSCGSGRNWGKGAIVEVTVDAHLLNLKVNSDRKNTLTGSGSMRFSGSGSLQMPFFANATVRTAQRPTPSQFEQSCLIDTALCYAYIGGSWVAYGNTGVGNATESAAGIVQMSTTGSILAHTAIGSTGASNAIGAKYTTASGGLTGLKRIGYIPVTEETGYLSGSLLGTNAKGGNKYLRNDGTWQTVVASSGANLQSNVSYSATSPTTTSTSFVDINASLVSTVTTSVGDLLLITFKGQLVSSNQAAETYLDIRVNGGRLGVIDGGGVGTLRGLLDVPTSAATADEAFNITHFHRVQTGGTLTISPMWKVSANTTTLRSSVDSPAYLQVVVVH